MKPTAQKVYPISQTSPDSVYAESYRNVVTNIELLSTSIRCFLVTSARTGEGKTATVANLGIVAAHAGKRVLLVDADLRHPKLAKRFHVSGDIGLTTVLRQECELQDALVSTDVSGLQLLASGRVGINSPSLLSSLAFTSLVGKCKSKFDLIIFDAPPVLAVSDALVLSRTVDGIVFVVDGKTTSRLSAVRALGEIQKVSGTVIGGILNRAPKDDDREYYYYRSADTNVASPH